MKKEGKKAQKKGWYEITKIFQDIFVKIIDVLFCFYFKYQ